MSISKKIFYKTVAVLPISLLKKASGIRTLLPYHHTVSDQPLEHIRHLYSYKNGKQFEQDLDFLLRHFEPVSVEEMVKDLNNGNDQKKGGFLLTFDDGFREVAEVIAPLLKKKGVPAVFFINPAFIDNKELFYRCKISILIGAIKQGGVTIQAVKQIAALLELPSDVSTVELERKLKDIDQTTAGVLNLLAPILGVDFDDYLKRHQPFLRSEQLGELVQNGFTLGGHSWDHPYYRLLSVSDQVAQTARSMEYVHQNYGPGPSLFSFPHDDRAVNSKFFQSMKDAQHSVDLFFGIQNQLRENENRVLHRFNAERPEFPIDLLVKGILTLDIVRNLTGRNNVSRN